MNNTIIDKINILVISSLTSFIDHYPDLKKIINDNKYFCDNWDFFMTVAGAGCYLLIYKNDKKEYNNVLDKLSEFDKQMPEAIKDFFQFVANSENKKLNIESVVGTWTLWNIAGKKSDGKIARKLILPIGNYLFKIVEKIK